MNNNNSRRANHPQDFGKVAVLFGGWSGEREVSLKSGNAVVQGLQRRGVDVHGIDADENVLEKLAAGKFDRVFIALHGRGGEDGVMQGALEVLGVPYTGSKVLGSALGMDKLRAKRLWVSAGLPTPTFRIIDEHTDLPGLVRELGLPLIIKPVHEGSSLGVAKVTHIDELAAAWQAARALDNTVLAERCIKGGEYTATILGDAVLPLIRIDTPHALYDYHAKYLASDTRYLCPCGLDALSEQTMQVMAMQAFQALDCSGWGRVDFMCDEQGHPWLIEVNTVPGMTDHSLAPMAARQAGIEFDELVWKILETTLAAPGILPPTALVGSFASALPGTS